MGRWVYEITPKGRRALDTWLKRSPRKPEAPRDEMFVRLLATDLSRANDVVAQLANQRRVYEEHLTELRKQRQLLDPVDDRRRLQALAIDAALLRSEAHLSWLEQCATALLSPHNADAQVV